MPKKGPSTSSRPTVKVKVKVCREAFQVIRHATEKS